MMDPVVDLASRNRRIYLSRFRAEIRKLCDDLIRQNISVELAGNILVDAAAEMYSHIDPNEEGFFSVISRAEERVEALEDKRDEAEPETEPA